MLIERDSKSFTEEELKTNIESKSKQINLFSAEWLAENRYQ